MESSNIIRSTIKALEEDYTRCLRGQSAILRPSLCALAEVVELCRALFFPHYYAHPDCSGEGQTPSISQMVERLHALLAEQITAALTIQPSAPRNPQLLAAQLIERLPTLRNRLLTDVEAAYLSDPAAETRDEIIACYPATKALVNYRVAHELHRLGIPLLPRILSEMAHSETGIDIHPGAQIGDYFTIDHGTGVVIGATCIIGAHVKLYQGVTLGAKNFPLDEEGNPIKHIPRHPIVGNNVIIYSNATLLGRITIGDHAVIGGNVWVTHDVAPHTTITKSAAPASPSTHEKTNFQPINKNR